MKSQEPQEKKFRELSDQELEKVNGGLRPRSSCPEGVLDENGNSKPGLTVTIASILKKDLL